MGYPSEMGFRRKATTPIGPEQRPEVLRHHLKSAIDMLRDLSDDDRPNPIPRRLSYMIAWVEAGMPGRPEKT